MKFKTKKLFFLLFTLLSLTFVLSVSSSAASISKKSATIYAGKSVNLKIKGTKKKATWSSSDPEIAKVSSSGKVTGVSQGKATISATIGEKTYKCKIKVNSNITLSKKSLTFKKNKAQTIKVTIRTTDPKDGTAYTVFGADVCKAKWSNKWSAVRVKNEIRLQTTLTVTPKDAGEATIAIYTTKNKKDIVKLKVTVK